MFRHEGRPRLSDRNSIYILRRAAMLDSCFSIYQISWIKMKKGTFCKLETSLSRKFVLNLKTFREFVKCIMLIQHENNYLSTSKEWQAKVRRFLNICLYDCFKFSLKFCLSKMSRNETPSWLRSQKSKYPKIFRVTGTNQKAQKLLFTDLNSKWQNCYLCHS